MKSILIVAAVALAFASCDEIGPQIQINGGGGGGGDTVQAKHVLFEEFTAVACINCPAAHSLLESILTSYQDTDVEVVEIHSGNLAMPLHASDLDLRTAEGEQLDGMLGMTLQPSASIDRKTNPPLVTGSWAGGIATEIQDTLKARIILEKTYNATSRKLDVTMKVTFLYDITDNLNASVMITESGLIAPQDSFINEISDYVHNNVLRGMLTPYNGVAVSGSTTAGTEWDYTFPSYTLNSSWDDSKCRIVAFVSKSAGPYDVLQTVGTNVK